MSIEAMKQAIEALNEAVAFREGGRQKAIDAITALRTAIQQAEAQQPATTEPVAQWQKRHPIRTAGRWISTDEHDAKWWSEHSRGWEVRPLYTHPSPSAPADVVRDAERYRWLRSLEHCNEAWCFIGSGNANSNLDAAIDAAMLAAKEASA